MSHIIYEEFRKPNNEQQEIIDESEARDVKRMISEVVVKTTVLLRRADYARIKKICEILDISFGEYTEEALRVALDGDIHDPEFLGERFVYYLQRIKDIES